MKQALHYTLILYIFLGLNTKLIIAQVVSNTNDSGAGSLRDAITNATAGSTISFNISGTGPHTINILSDLPSITAAGVIIDATAQPGYSTTTQIPQIIIDGNSSTGPFDYGLGIEAANVAIYGIEFINHSTAIRLGNGADNIVIGATDKRNVFYGNTWGIRGANNNLINGGTIENNYFGTDATGMMIPGTADSEGVNINDINSLLINSNLFSGNNYGGIQNAGDNFMITNNIFGYAADGTTVLQENGNDNIQISAVGGLIDNNQMTGSGMGIFLNDSDGITISNNNILDSRDFGILASSCQNLIIDNNIISESSFAQANISLGTSDNCIVSNNELWDAGYGVVTSGQQNRITQNSIYCHISEGIDFSNGGNNNKPRPNILNVSTTNIDGTSEPNDVVEVFMHETCTDDPCQGKTYLGTTTADASGNWTLNAFVTAPILGSAITATATDANNNTSRFAACQYIYIPATGVIDGCGGVCTGGTAGTSFYNYSVSGYSGPTTYNWTANPSNVALIISGQGTTDIQILHLDTSNPFTLIVTPENTGLYYQPTEFSFVFDPQGVWPGDIDYDDQFNVTMDITALNAAFTAWNDYLIANPGSIGIPRIPCNSIKDWECQPAQPWNISFLTSSLDLKHADADGDGIIESNTGAGYDPTIPGTMPVTDMDILACRYYDDPTVTHNGNAPAKQQTSNNNYPINIQPMDVTLANGNELRFIVTLGSSNNPITDVHSVAFVVQFTLGSFNNPSVDYLDSHLDNIFSLQHAEYPFMVSDTTQRKWLISMGRKTLTGQTFEGEELCKGVCIITIDDLQAKLATPSPAIVDISIVEAGLRHSNGEFEPLIGNTAQVAISLTQPIRVKAKAFLESNLDISTGLMNTALNNNGLIPLQQPFNTAPWNYSGDEAVLSAADIPANVVDWVLLEMREATNPNNIVEQRAAFLNTDGTIADFLGGSTADSVYFYNLLNNNNYYLAIRQRNHLDVISATPITVSNNELIYNFTNSPTAALGSATQLKAVNTVNGTVYALHAGDFNGDGIINVSDFNLYEDNSATTNAYIPTDLDLNGSVTIQDFNFYQPNASKMTVKELRY